MRAAPCFICLARLAVTLERVAATLPQYNNACKNKDGETRILKTVTLPLANPNEAISVTVPITQALPSAVYYVEVVTFCTGALRAVLAYRLTAH